MKALLRALCGTLLLTLASPLVASASGAGHVDEAWIKAMKSGDLDAVMKCYAPNATVWVTGAPAATGSAAIRAQYAAYFSGYAITDVSIHELGSTTVGADSVSWGTFSVTTTPKSGGAEAAEVGRYTEVARKSHGHWVYTVDHASDDPAPEAGK